MAITYPVAPNSRWSLWRISSGEIVQRRIRWPRADGMELVGADPDLVPLLEVDEAQPAFDSATQTVQRSAPVVDVDANTHTHGWSVRALTQAELDAKAAQAQHNSDRDQVQAVYADLKAGAGTQLERLARVEKVCAFLLKNQFYDAL